MATLSELNSPLQLQLARDPTGAPPEISGYLEEIYSAFYQLQLALVQYCGIAQQPSFDWPRVRPSDTIFQNNANRLYVQASEAIPQNSLISLHAVGSLLAVRLANATTNSRPCHGFCSTDGGIASTEFGEVILYQGLITGLTGLTPATMYYLSTTAGGLTSTAPVAAGNIKQVAGIALSADTLYLNAASTWIQH